MIYYFFSNLKLYGFYVHLGNHAPIYAITYNHEIDAVDSPRYFIYSGKSILEYGL